MRDDLLLPFLSTGIIGPFVGGFPAFSHWFGGCFEKMVNVANYKSNNKRVNSKTEQNSNSEFGNACQDSLGQLGVMDDLAQLCLTYVSHTSNSSSRQQSRSVLISCNP